MREELPFSLCCATNQYPLSTLCAGFHPCAGNKTHLCNAAALAPDGTVVLEFPDSESIAGDRAGAEENIVMMNRHRIHFIYLAVIAIVALAAGCGGGKKKQGRAGEPEGVLAGAVDTFTGFGVELRQAGDAARLDEDSVVRLYRVQPDGSGLAPLSQVQAALLKNGVFKLEGIPLGERNLIVRIETDGGEPLLSAIAPPIGPLENHVIVSPETHLEARVFADTIASGIFETRDVTPDALDASIIKMLVRPELFYDYGCCDPGNGEGAGGTTSLLAGLARYAYAGFTRRAFGGEAEAGSPEGAELNAALAGPLMEMEIKYDTGKQPGAEAIAALDEALDEAASGAGLEHEMMSAAAVWTVARRNALRAAAFCIADRPNPENADCPHFDDPPAWLNEYARTLDDSFTSRWHCADHIRRRNILFPPHAATGSIRLMPVETIMKLLDLPPSFTRPFVSALEEDSGLCAPQSIKKDARVMADFRDNLLVGAAGLDRKTLLHIASRLNGEKQQLLNSLRDPFSDMKSIASAHRQLLGSYPSVFKQLEVVLKTRFAKLERNDLGKLTLSFYRTALAASLIDIPPALHMSMDSDGDGAPDNAEKTAGTSAADPSSAPTRVLSATPRSMLPAAPQDSDGDGFTDRVEDIVGTDSGAAISAPVPGRMRFCGMEVDYCLPDIDKMEEPATDETWTLTGEAVFAGEAAPGVTVGLYKEPGFMDRRPDFAAPSVTDTDGLYEVKCDSGGGVFAVGFVDTDGNGAPSAGEPAGYAGEELPRRLHGAGGAAGATATVEIKGIIGGGRCPGADFYDPILAECAAECSGGLEPNALTGECVCPGGELFVLPAGACAASCPPGTALDTIHGSCVCPPGAAPDHGSGLCVCPEGMSLDEGELRCVCDEGYLIEQTFSCMAACPGTFVADEETGACVCPAGAEYSENEGACVCLDGYLDVHSQACVSSCPGGMAPGGAEGICACPVKETFSIERGECVCEEGLERNAQGGCEAFRSAPPAALEKVPQAHPQLHDRATGPIDTAPPPATATGPLDISPPPAAEPAPENRDPATGAAGPEHAADTPETGDGYIRIETATGSAATGTGLAPASEPKQ